MAQHGKVIWHTSMSLDGFVAGPNHSMDLLAVGWLPKLASEGLPPQTKRIAESTGAILAGRRWHDAVGRLGGLEGIYGGHWKGPVLVLTSRPEGGPDFDGVTFVSDGIENAVASALEASGGGDVVVFGPTMATQCLDAGLLDEIAVGVVPVLLGDGIRFFGGDGVGSHRLEPVEVSPMGYLAHLHYRVLK